MRAKQLQKPTILIVNPGKMAGTDGRHYGRFRYMIENRSAIQNTRGGRKSRKIAWAARRRNVATGA
jgi:hypothetical protein